MYSAHDLDSLPPPSQFRRPWSPDPYLPSVQASSSAQGRSIPGAYNFDNDAEYDPYRPDGQQHPQRREPSDVSVEALDLADYAMDLNSWRNQNLRQYVPPADYPPSPPHQPLSSRLTSVDSRSPPSLVSRGDTLTTNTLATNIHSNTSDQSRYSSRGQRRPFSLPPPHSHSSRQTVQPTYRNHNFPYIAGDFDLSPPPPASATNPSEVDISHFPPWSREWFGSKSPPLTSPPDIYSQSSSSNIDPTKRSFFDPGNTWKPSNSYPQSDKHGSSYLGHDSRDLLPWSNNDPPEYGSPVDSVVKEERMRMLEKEFGADSTRSRRKEGDFVDEEGNPLVGTVDAKGYIVTQGPRKRSAVRVLQVVLSLAAAIPSIYAALAIKPNETPPPAGKPAAFVLYIVSVVTFLALTFLFVIRPCCGGRNKGGDASKDPFTSGMMVLPVQGLPGGKKKKPKKGKAKGGKKGGPPAMGDVQVNLIVDPHVFGGRQEEESDEDAAEEYSSFGGGSHGKKRKAGGGRRRSVFAGLAMEERWKAARAWLKKMTAVDVGGLVVWGAVFIVILMGARCPSGGFDGWCNAYNTSTAAACLLCVAFGVSVFFDIKDLHTSKTSPRTRT